MKQIIRNKPDVEMAKLHAISSRKSVPWHLSLKLSLISRKSIRCWGICSPAKGRETMPVAVGSYTTSTPTLTGRSLPSSRKQKRLGHACEMIDHDVETAVTMNRNTHRGSHYAGMGTMLVR